jgi:Helicase HerA, central domain
MTRSAALPVPPLGAPPARGPTHSRRPFQLGNYCALDRKRTPQSFELPAHHLTTHGVIVGMTGSGKTGLLSVMVEEALRSNVPVLMLDVKGDLPNLALSFPTFASSAFEPWVEPAPGDPRSVTEVAQALAAERQHALESWGVSEADLLGFSRGVDVRIITPGSDAGESLHVLSSLEHASSNGKRDPAAARASLSSAISLLLRLLKRDPEPATSRDHVFLSVLAEARLARNLPCDLGALLLDVTEPPIETVGSLPIDQFISARERGALAAALNTLLASPTFASWRQGAALDIQEWLTPKHGKTPAVIVSVAHLDDDDRALVLGIILEELLTWVRNQRGTKHLRALVVFDEVYGFLPPHPANPPTKQPIVALMKQARAFGVGVVIATQNPMDLDYRALSNAGLWCVGRLQTDADRARVIEGLAQNTSAGSETAAALARLSKSLYPRWFIMRDVHSKHGTVLLQPRWALSYLRGPMTPAELRMARELGLSP